MYPRRTNILALAIIVAGIMVGGAILLTRGDKNSESSPTSDTTTRGGLDSVRPVQPDDHVLGNPNAPIVLVTYSDFSCPFCKEYHKTLHDLIDLNGREGQVSWVFRHIPIVQMHDEAPMYALASECVAKNAGNQAFWTFSDSLFDAIDVDVKPDTNKLLDLAEKAGVARQTFTSCMRDNTLMSEVEMDFDEAIAAGATASPFTVLLTPDGRTSYEGARPFNLLSGAVQAALKVTSDSNEFVSPSASTNATKFDLEGSEFFESTSTESLVPIKK